MKKQILQQRLAGQDFVLLDGAMGTMLLAAGLKLGENPELLRWRDRRCFWIFTGSIWLLVQT